MVALYPVKLLSIISIDSMEERLVAMFKKYGVGGYAIVRARGEDSMGLQADINGFDSNILVKVLVPVDRLDQILESVERKMRKGYHLTVFVSDVHVITPGKFEKPLPK